MKENSSPDHGGSTSLWMDIPLRLTPGHMPYLECSFSCLRTIIYSLKFHCPGDHLPKEH